MHYLIGHAIPDDAFYYFQVARNVVHGHGVSADGEVWANGFHPLWMLVLLPVYLLSGGQGDVPIHVALSASALTTSGSGVLLYLTGRRLGLSAPVSLISTAAYLFHPVLIFMSIDGLETGLNVSVFVALLYAFVVAYQRPTQASYALAAVLAGLLVLSRTDYAIVSVSILGTLLMHSWRLRSAAMVAAIFGAITGPWLLWNQIVFGSPFPVSASALPYIEHQIFDGGSALSGAGLWHSVVLVRQAALHTIPYFYFTPSRGTSWLAVAFVSALALISGGSAVRDQRRERRTAVVLLAVPLAGIGVQLLVHAGVRWYVREWYFVPLFPLLALLLGLAIEICRESRVGAVGGLAICTIVLVGTAPTALRTFRDGWYPVQVDMRSAADWIATTTPAGTRVGGYNSGVVGYYSGRTTVNLDGVMNPDALQALRDRRMAAYITERKIDVLVDFPFYAVWLYQRFLGGDLNTRELTSFDDHATFQGSFTIYAVGAAGDAETGRR
ncbi:MAG: glycosyltransferase family 39 protein [Chloroflexota bacterium]|nr:glycosyltransferase family 39 protein [Chloroflexota bacterium]